MLMPRVLHSAAMFAGCLDCLVSYCKVVDVDNHCCWPRNIRDVTFHSRAIAYPRVTNEAIVDSIRWRSQRRGSQQIYTIHLLGLQMQLWELDSNNAPLTAIVVWRKVSSPDASPNCRVAWLNTDECEVSSWIVSCFHNSSQSEWCKLTRPSSVCSKGHGAVTSTGTL